MRCPYCKQLDSRVIDSRGADDGNSIRRRRECTACGRRFTTYEVVEKMPLIVIKNDGRRVVFDHDKLLNGLIRSCDKRNIPTQKVVALADEIERELRNTMDREVTTKAIGEM
ncbi:MAG: transcriptional repressor NrdR, partial [Schwartzia sp.]|nr:transcriptional repressor NrdR [Schwartzia sp. (in: firmicutes)]